MQYNFSEIKNPNGTPDSHNSPQLNGYYIQNPLSQSDNLEYSSGGTNF